MPFAAESHERWVDGGALHPRCTEAGLLQLALAEENLAQKCVPATNFVLACGGQRLLQEAQGYRAVIVGGEIVLANDELTGRYPGRLVRMGQLQTQAAA